MKKLLMIGVLALRQAVECSILWWRGIVHLHEERQQVGAWR